MKPEFVDNLNGNTLASALRDHLVWLDETYKQPVELSIATGYFNPGGFALIADQLEALPRIRLLLGAEPTPPPARPIRKPGDPRGHRFEDKLIREAIEANAKGFVRDRDHLQFCEETDIALKKLIAFLDSGRIEVRRYEKGFLHGKAFIFANDEGVMAGSSNFTAAGLTSNLELNLGRYDPTPVRQVKNWFDSLWDQAVPFDLAEVYRGRFLEYDPYLIYLRVLWELYGEELEEESQQTSRIHLTSFQNDGLWRARRILERYHGVIVADGVGLGKSYIAGELIREAVEDRRQRVLLVAPAALRDGMWERFRHEHQIYIETVSYEQLARDAQLGGEEHHLKFAPNEYAMVVIDEAHAFRNPNAVRAQALRALLMGKPPKKLVLLTATPVNNSLWDLYYLLLYFVGHDAAFAIRGIQSLRERFKQATREDPYDLRPDMLFDILDEVTVRRTRHFVRRYYPHDRIVGPGGAEIPVHFPSPHVRAITYDVENVLPGFFSDFEQALAPENGPPLLTMARYWPSQYRSDLVVDESQIALVGLIRSGLLKRFESSVYAFQLTAQRMVESHEAFLDALDKGYILTPEALEEWSNTDNDEDWEEILANSGAESTTAYDVDRLRGDIENDRNILKRLAEQAANVDREVCPKLARLVDALANITLQAENEGIDEEDRREKRKVVIFSYFADTVDWIEEYLHFIVSHNPRIGCYQNRIVSVAGQDVRKGVSREDAIFGFVPQSSDAPSGRDKNRFDLLITTDVLAEGVNLQQCRNIINYDLPWNPMRLVQRHGRIDRIGSPHTDVYVRCFFPDRRLDAMLQLEGRIRTKLAQAAASIGVESEVIPDGATNDVIFTETRKEIEALREGETDLLETAGEDPHAHSGEEYRQELRQGLLSRLEEIKLLPWASGSGIAGGLEKGHVFCAHIGDRLFLRFVPFREGRIRRNTLQCLRLITCAPDSQRHMPTDLAESTYKAWKKASADIYAEWTHATDPANLQPRIRPLFKNAANHLRNHPPKGITQTELDTAIESLEAPWGLRIERAIKQVFMSEKEDSLLKSIQLIQKIKELGLQPFIQPEPLPVIAKEEITLICWMAIDDTLV